MGYKILVVDDEVAILKVIRLKFRKEIAEGSFDMLFFDNPEDVLNLVQSDLNNEIKIIMTDINMPKMNGFELCQKVIGLRKDIVFYVSSAYDRQDYRDKATDHGAKKFFAKPVNFDELKSDFFEELKVLTKAS